MSFIESVAAVFAIIGGSWGAYQFIRRLIESKPYTKALSIFSGTNELRDSLLRLEGRTVNFDTVIDFSICNTLSSRIAEETEYGRWLSESASNLNGKRLPLYIETPHDALDSFAYLVLQLNKCERLKFSYGGTGIVHVLLKGRFDIEVRHYSGPSVEITLRETSI